MTVQEVAQPFTALVGEGKFEEAMKQFYAESIESVEASGGEGSVVRGMEAIHAKAAWWEANHTMHSIQVKGPFPSGDKFAVLMMLDITYKPENKRFTMEEVAVYTVKDGKIVHEQFFYDMG